MTSTIPLHSFTCCPSFWDDRRTIDSRGLTQGTVVHRASGDTYGKACYSDTNLTIQKKMVLLFIGTPFIGILRIIARIGHLLSGHWAWKQGCEEALASWKDDRRIAVLTNSSKKAPGRIDLYARTVLYSLYRFSEALIKLVTQPLALALAMGASLIAVADPLLSRRFFAKIEEIWSIHLGEWSALDSIINYSAPCMQPDRVSDSLNFYRSFEDFDPQSIRSQLFSLKKNLQDSRSYFSETDYLFFLDRIHIMKNKIKQISPKDEVEIQKMKEPAASPEKEKIIEARKTLHELTKLIQSSLKEIDRFVDEYLEQEESAASASDTKKLLQQLRTDLKAEFCRAFDAF